MAEPSGVPAAPKTEPVPGGESTPDPVPPSARRRRRVLSVLAVLGLTAIAASGYWGWDRYRTRRAWSQAEDALRRRDLPAASAHLDRYIASRPEDPEGWFRAARTARRRGQFAEATRYLSECEKLGGATDATRLERDLLVVQQGGLGEIDARLRATVGPDHPDVLFVLEALARGYLLTERWADARQACELWRALQPDHPWPWLWSGWVSERLVQTDQAADFYRRALDLVPEDRDARIAYARMLVRQRLPGAAAPYYEAVLAQAPDDGEALVGLARCRLDEGRADQAVPLLDRAEARDPASVAVVYLRGKAALQRGDPVAAEGRLRLVVRAEPSDGEALHVLVLCLRAQRKDAEADELARRLEALQQDLRRFGDLLRLITPQLADAGPCHEAGVIALRVGRAKEGVNLLREALRRKGDHRPTHAALADHYRKAGNTSLADFHHRLAGAP